MAKGLSTKFGFSLAVEPLWDAFWVATWQNTDSGMFFEGTAHMEPNLETAKLSAEEFYKTPITNRTDDQPSAAQLSIFCAGKDIVDKSVLELGAGCGWAGKRIALHAKKYLGLDYSKLAAAIGNVVSPDNAHFDTFSAPGAIEGSKEQYDTVITRNHLIHANYDAALASAKTAYWVLKPGGLYYASFFRVTPEAHGGIFYAARTDTDLQNLTCGYDYTRYDVEDIAKRTKLKVESYEAQPEAMRTHVVFKK